MRRARAAVVCLNLALLAVRSNASAGEAAPSQTAAPADNEEIVITATGRVSAIQDVPGSVSVFTSDTLDADHATTIKDLKTLTPSLNTINSIGESFGQLISIRGVTTSGADAGLEPGAGITLDGVPLARPNIALFDLQGVDRVEILRGPQGTLFGANSTAGIINVLTRRPDFAPEFDASMSFGNWDLHELRLSAGGGIVPDRLAIRLDALAAGTNGYLRDPELGRDFGGHERQQLRAQLLWLASPQTEVRLIADVFHHDGTINGPVFRVAGPTGPLISSLSGLVLRAFYNATDITQIDGDAPRFESSDSAGVTLDVGQQTALGRLTALASYRSTSANRSYDVDGGPASLANDPKDGERYSTSTLELRLQGQRGRFDYLFGAFVGGELIDSRDSYTLGQDFDAYADALGQGYIPIFTGLPAGQNFPAGSGVFDVFRQQATRFALFSHHIVTLTDWLSLTLGLRYSGEEKSLSANLTSNNPGCSAALARNGASLSGVPSSLQGLICIPNLDPRYDGHYTASRSEGNWSGTTALTARLAEWLNAYTGYSRGYKPGGYQLDRSGMDPLSPNLSQLAFRQETADSFETGLRAESPDSDWHANLSLFYSRFSNYQFSYFTGLNRRIDNVPELVSKGVEAEAGYRPVQPLELSVAATYLESVFGQSGFPAALTQVEGTTAPLAPRWVVVGGATFEQNLSAAVLGFANLGLRWQSRSYVGGSASLQPDFFQDPYAVVDARIGISGTQRKLQIELWVRNLFDQHAWSILNNTTLQPGSISGYVIEPRSFGVTLSAGL